MSAIDRIRQSLEFVSGHAYSGGKSWGDLREVKTAKAALAKLEADQRDVVAALKRFVENHPCKNNCSPDDMTCDTQFARRVLAQIDAQSVQTETKPPVDVFGGNRKYFIFDANGRLVARHSWYRARVNYAGADDVYTAVYIRRDGKLGIKWLTTNLEASAAETSERIDQLNRTRRNAGLSTVREAMADIKAVAGSEALRGGAD